MNEAAPDPIDPKAALLRYLGQARESMLWKLEGLDDYQIRQPLTPTGTNLLGLVKHLALVEQGYLLTCLGATQDPSPISVDRAIPNADMFALATESRAEVLAFYRSVAEQADEHLQSLSLDDTGYVPWWPEEANPVSVQRLLVHMIAETNRHLGHADILREGMDQSVGLRRDGTNLPEEDEAWWRDYVQRVDDQAVAAVAAASKVEPNP